MENLLLSEFAKDLAIVTFLVLVNERVFELIWEKFLKKLWNKFNLDPDWAMLLSWISGSGLVLLSHVNLFSGYIVSDTAGWIATAVFAGGGSNLLHEIFAAGQRARERHNNGQ